MDREYCLIVYVFIVYLSYSFMHRKMQNKMKMIYFRSVKKEGGESKGTKLKGILSTRICA